MENILLTIDIILAVLLIILILIQKSEGGALGLGISQDSFMFSRTAGDFFSRSTAVVATLFIICSLSLTIISRQDLPSSSSIIDKIEENEDDNMPKIPKNNNYYFHLIKILLITYFHGAIYIRNRRRGLFLRQRFVISIACCTSSVKRF